MAWGLTSSRSRRTRRAWSGGAGVTDDSAAAAASESSPFARFTQALSGGIPLRSNDRSNEEEASSSCVRTNRYFALSRWERFLGFLLCCAGASACFAVSFFIGLPLLAIKPRKFAVSLLLTRQLRPLLDRLTENVDHEQVLFMVGFAILSGPVAHAKHLFSAERLPFTAAYFGSLFLTLFFALCVALPSRGAEQEPADDPPRGRHSYFATLVCGIVQCAALVFYFVSYFPGGFQTLSFGSRMALRGAGSLLPV
ncbi:SPOSA6832_04506, partial [Sporobolomyces salmonicolor]